MSSGSSTTEPSHSLGSTRTGRSSGGEGCWIDRLTRHPFFLIRYNSPLPQRSHIRGSETNPHPPLFDV
jgi:hypothetical protein